jgi:hypothetical protein
MFLTTIYQQHSSTTNILLHYWFWLVESILIYLYNFFSAFMLFLWLFFVLPTPAIAQCITYN